MRAFVSRSRGHVYICSLLPIFEHENSWYDPYTCAHLCCMEELLLHERICVQHKRIGKTLLRKQIIAISSLLLSTPIDQA